MKTLILATMLLATYANASIYSAKIVHLIKGFKEYKLGGDMPAGTRSTPNIKYYYSKGTNTFRVMLHGNSKKKIVFVQVQFGYKQDHGYRTTVAAYKKMVKKAIKKYGAGEGKETATFRGREAYTIRQGKRSMTISKHGPYLRVAYSLNEPKEKIKPKPVKEEDVHVEDI